MDEGLLDAHAADVFGAESLGGQGRPQGAAVVFLFQRILEQAVQLGGRPFAESGPRAQGVEGTAGLVGQGGDIVASVGGIGAYRVGLREGTVIDEHGDEALPGQPVEGGQLGQRVAGITQGVVQQAHGQLARVS